MEKEDHSVDCEGHDVVNRRKWKIHPTSGERKPLLTKSTDGGAADKRTSEAGTRHDRRFAEPPTASSIVRGTNWSYEGVFLAEGGTEDKDVLPYSNSKRCTYIQTFGIVMCRSLHCSWS